MMANLRVWAKSLPAAVVGALLLGLRHELGADLAQALRPPQLER